MSTSLAVPPGPSPSAPPRPGLRLGLAPKLLGVVGLLALLAAGVAAGAIHIGAHQAALMERIEGLGSRGITLGRANVNFVSWVRGVEFLPLDLSAEDRRRWEAAATDQMQRLEKRLDEVRPVLTLPESRRDLVRVEAAIASYRKVHAEVQALARAGKLDAATRAAMAAAAEVEATDALLREMQLRVVRTLDALKTTAGEETASAQAWLIGGSLGGILLGTGLALLIVLRGITGPLKRLTATAGGLAEGRIDTPVEATGRADEVGEIARGLEVLRHGALHARALEQEAATARAGAETVRLQARRDLADRVERELGAVVQGLTASVGTLEGGIATLGGTADGTAERAASVAAGATQATTNVQTVAAAAEELASSVNEITRQVTTAAQVARRAVQDAREADGTVGGLSEAAQRIGDVVRLIGDIAGQTNLLALNATIEAARAGEAGKGFAVVASEVKTLASQTAKATEEIGAQIAAIQGATERAVQSIKGIAEVVAEVDGISATIAAAVEEQGAATREIARNVAEAAQGTNDVSANIAHVSAGVEETTRALAGLREATGTVARQGVALREGLAGLLQGLRAA